MRSAKEGNDELLYIDPDLAVRHAEIILQATQVRDDPIVSATAHWTLGNAYVFDDLPREAIACFKEAARLYEAANRPLDVARVGVSRVAAETDLGYPDRALEIARRIGPALEAGKVVILDRYYFSTMAYQGARGFDPDTIRRDNEAFAPVPDLLLVFDLDLDTALDRIGARDGSANEFEKRESLAKCRAIFRSLTDPFVHHLDANRSVEEIHRDVVEAVAARDAR